MVQNIYGFMLERVEDYKIDVTAQALGVSRDVLLEMVLKHSKRLSSKALPLKCAIYAHEALQRVALQLEQIGFTVEYRVRLTDANIAETIGFFGIGTDNNRLSRLCNAGVITKPPYFNGIKGELDIIYEHPEDADTKALRGALKEVEAWSKTLRKIDRVGLEATATLLVLN